MNFPFLFSFSVAMGNCLFKPKTNTNHSQLCRLLTGVGTRVLREFFDSIHRPDSLHETLKDPNKKEIFERLHSEGDLSSVRWRILCGTSADDISSQNFDTVLLCFLLKYFSNLKPPKTGWNENPLFSDLSREADFARILLFRNSIGDYTLCITDEDFRKFWNDMKNVLVRLGGKQYTKEIDNLKKKRIDAKEEKNFTEKLISWKIDEESLSMGMKEIEREMTLVEDIEDTEEDSAADDESERKYMFGQICINVQ